MHTSALLLLGPLLAGCGASGPDDDVDPSPGPAESSPTPEGSSPTPTTSSPTPAATVYADVLAVDVTGAPGNYTFGVTVLSPDVDCGQYADWWEVLAAEGTLVYRRILEHSHPDEQPFTRTGEPVPILEDDPVIVRAHMNTGGYGGAALEGTVSAGIATPADLPAGFAAEVEEQPPLPEDCLF